MIVYLIRHGETGGNAQKKYSGGGSDEPLSPRGITLAKEAGAFYGEPRVFVSPMLRTRQTAAMLLPDAEIVLSDGIREMHFGDFEGRSHDELLPDPRYIEWLQTQCTSECPHGESIATFRARVSAAFDGIVRAEIARRAKRVCVVAHGGTIMGLLDRYAVTATPTPYTEWLPGNLCGWRAELDEADWPAHPALLHPSRIAPPYAALTD